MTFPLYHLCYPASYEPVDGLYVMDINQDTMTYSGTYMAHIEYEWWGVV